MIVWDLVSVFSRRSLFFTILLNHDGFGQESLQSFTILFGSYLNDDFLWLFIDKGLDKFILFTLLFLEDHCFKDLLVVVPLLSSLFCFGAFFNFYTLEFSEVFWLHTLTFFIDLLCLRPRIIPFAPFFSDLILMVSWLWNRWRTISEIKEPPKSYLLQNWQKRCFREQENFWIMITPESTLPASSLINIE